MLSNEIYILFQISQMKSSSGSGTPTSEDRTLVNRTEYNERVQELNSLRTEYERCRKDKNITAGLVTQMQRDMSNKVGKNWWKRRGWGRDEKGGRKIK